MENLMRRCVLGGLALATAALSLVAPTPVDAHGEKAQAPFLRMRTIQWYDVHWGKKEFAVNERMKLSGKMHVMSEEHWPQTTTKPELSFLNIAIPGPVVVRKSSYLNGVHMANSTNLKLGGTYDFEVEVMGRMPYDVHMHTMLNIAGAGPVIGPGKWVKVTGDYADFDNKIKTLDGRTIDIETYGFDGVVFWHVLWAVIGVVWLVYWLAKPLFFHRWQYVKVGRGDELITMTDKALAVVMVALAFGITGYGFMKSFSDNPLQLPLQGALAHTEPSPKTDQHVDVKYITATYAVPGREMKFHLEVTNRSSSPIKFGEFATATVRFINPSVGFKDELSKDYPEDLMAENGLSVSDDTPIAPGETRKVWVSAKDAAWEVQNLSSLIYDPDSRFAGLLFLYGEDGSRHIVETGGVLIPDFKLAAGETLTH